MTALARRRLLAAVALTPLAAWAPTASAQGLPDRPIRLIVGFPPGTGPDLVARMLAQRLAEQLRQQVIVDNRAGAGGQIAAQAVARAAPDGTTLLLGEVGSIAIAPAAFEKLPYAPARELAGISEAVRSDFLFVVPATSPHTSLATFVKAARSRGDRTNLATFGAGTPGHFAADMLGEAAGFTVEPVHYRATGDAVTAIIAGDVAGAFVSTALGLAQIRGGRMRALATTAPARLAALPEVQTFAEAGWPALDVSAWFMLMAPAGTQAALLDLLQRQTVGALQHPETRTKLSEAGFSITGSSRPEAERLLVAEARRWAGVVRSSGFKGD